jgi:hypothetical protein
MPACETGQIPSSACSVGQGQMQLFRAVLLAALSTPPLQRPAHQYRHSRQPQNIFPQVLDLSVVEIFRIELKNVSALMS